MPTDLLAELVADAQLIVLPQPRTVATGPAPVVVEQIVIPESAATLMDGYADYGS